MKSKEHLSYLFDRYLSKTCTAAEKKELMELLADPSYEAQWNELNEGLGHIPSRQTILAEGNTASVWEAIQERTTVFEQAVVKPLYRKWWAAAAAVLLMAGAAGYFWIGGGKKAEQPSVTAKTETAILPGESGAVLKLDDGRMIILDSAHNGVVASNAAADIVVKDGNLTYQPLEGAATTKDIYNTMVTMRGKTYKMTLPDGTRVWLNASTQFRYPIAFNGKERRVRLSGEAYFEVAEDPAKLFIVDVDQKGEVKVLGTHFNVSAYPEDNAFTTTLLKGKVHLSSGYKNSKGMNQEITLKPSDQAIFREGQDMIVKPADMEQTMAWKNGQFVFKSANLPQVFNQLARWYDVIFVNDENINAEFSGSMYRTDDFYQLLKLIEFTSNVSFRVEGRKVFVTNRE